MPINNNRPNFWYDPGRFQDAVSPTDPTSLTGGDDEFSRGVFLRYLTDMGFGSGLKYNWASQQFNDAMIGYNSYKWLNPDLHFQDYLKSLDLQKYWAGLSDQERGIDRNRTNYRMRYLPRNG